MARQTKNDKLHDQLCAIRRFLESLKSYGASWDLPSTMQVPDLFFDLRIENRFGKWVYMMSFSGGRSAYGQYDSLDTLVDNIWWHVCDFAGVFQEST